MGVHPAHHVCLEVLESFGLVTSRKGRGHLHIRLRKRREGGKLAFYQSPIIQRLQTIAWGEEEEAVPVPDHGPGERARERGKPERDAEKKGSCVWRTS